MPNLRTLRWLGIAAPLAFVVGLGLTLRLGLTPNLPDPIAYTIAGIIAAAAIVAFAWAIFDQMERMQARLERQAHELRALYEAGMALTSELSLDALLQKLVDLGRLLTGARYGALGIVGADGSIERFHFSGMSEEEARRIGDPPQGRGLLGVILKEGASLRLRDIASDPRRASFPPNHPRMRSLLGLPVVSRGKVIGNLYLTDKQTAAEFSERDEEIVRLLTTQAAIAIENAHLYQAAERRAAEWKALFELGEEVTASPELQGVLDSAVERARSLLGTEIATLMLLSPDGGELHMAAHSGLRTPSMRHLRLPADHGLQGLVVEAGRPVTVDEYQADPQLRDRPAELVAEEGVVSAIAVPFSAKGKLLGTLTVANRKPTRFAERQAELLVAFANWAAVAVETGQLYERVKSLALLEERERIGMDLHDGVIQSIYAVGLVLEGVAEQAQESPSLVRENLDKAIDDLNRVIRDIRNYIFDLRPQVSEISNLKRALRDLVEEVKVNTLMEADLLVDGELPPLGQEQVLSLFHIAQEALNNVAKHAGASAVRVRLAANGHALTLEVDDNGSGFDPEKRDKAKHGLRNMQDRARMLGAELKIESSAGKGTTVRVTMALAREGATTSNGG
ncbi:MAG: GAF domain-containing protein [Dehalococcoidia bacterium]